MDRDTIHESEKYLCQNSMERHESPETGNESKFMHFLSPFQVLEIVRNEVPSNKISIE